MEIFIINMSIYPSVLFHYQNKNCDYYSPYKQYTYINFILQKEVIRKLPFEYKPFVYCIKRVLKLIKVYFKFNTISNVFAVVRSINNN